MLFNFRIQKELYDYLSYESKREYTTMSQYLIDLIKKGNQELYYARNNKNYLVSILEQDDTFFTLSDGSRISQILFYQTFVKVETVEPEKFFASKSQLTQVAEQLINNDQNQINKL